MYFLDQKIYFPPAEEASSDGLIAVGGDLSLERLLHAYEHGIFPWYEEGGPILWWSPDPRFVLVPEELKVSKSMKSIIKKDTFKITENTAFNEVVEQCSGIKRKDQQGTWITDEMKTAYETLHQAGYAHSIEVWQNQQLVGGLYGVDLGNEVFCGESMFTKVSNASKLALIYLAHTKRYRLIDCQLHTAHLERMGAKNIPRQVFLKHLVF